jgi:hypothetical protein
MRSGSLSVLAWILIGGGVAALTHAGAHALAHPSVVGPAPLGAQAFVSQPYPGDSLSLVIAGHDVFRATRAPAGVAYDPVAGNAPSPDAPPKPALTLVGIVAGHDPTALVEGFPGVEGSRVVRVGDVVAGLRVRSIDQATVRIAGLDTMWVLRVREPWQ